MTLNALKNNADINVTGGTLMLGANFTAGNNGTLELGPGTLQTNGGDITNFDSITLTGDATIDLTGSTNETLDFSGILTTDGGSYNLNFVGWESTDTVGFDNPLPAGVTVLVDGSPASLDANNVIIGVIPEVSTMHFIFGLGILGLWYELRRKRSN